MNADETDCTYVYLICFSKDYLGNVLTHFFFVSFYYREVQCLWKAKLGPAANIVPAEKVSSLFNDLQIFPTHAQGKIYYVGSETP